MQGKSKPQILKHFLAASAAFLVAGGAFAQAAATAPAPAPSQRGDMHHHMDHGGGMWMKSVDTDGDGAISKAEADALFNRIDTNHDGKLDKSEMAAYRKASMEQRRAEMQKEFDAKFKAADKNGDGALTKDEANAGLPRLAKHFDQLDANHDGKLTQDESRPACRRCTRSACSACRADREHRQRPERLPAAAAEPADPSACPDSGQGWCRRATFNGSRFFFFFCGCPLAGTGISPEIDRTTVECALPCNRLGTVLAFPWSAVANRFLPIVPLQE